MESQLTLVDIPELKQATQNTPLFASTVLQFTRNCTHNTTITINGQPSKHYAVHSDKYATTTRVTRIVDGSGPVSVGVIQRRNLLPDHLTVGGADIQLNQWLEVPLLHTLPARMHVHGSRYTWWSLSWNQLALYADDKPSANPIAWLDRARVKQPVNGQHIWLPPMISMHEDAEEMADEIVLAVVILEHRLRMADKARATQIASVSGGHLASIASQTAIVFG
ncbi:uncharacterized protein PHACADRAFT_257211 [Phanerochaete carnosa HHB-10118-sp]|uniref:DUF6593 domain-containing protein n=1 Tax=Phanerochaete carnosa (strain HHB-10118-sp) TaxID=650164 RepID=K5VX33_PHACS|nr:uncharacterized protein PHACADRAFT_257211 [Phanerochaete carnosa HHB-10118-sp]EKM56133.1 hypothetical protein PHACADRAFT_257211 [Phanerochaete carnosa HHB-10118-sp]